MSHELAPLSDPGLPEHVHRKADVDPRAAKKAERQVGILFLFSVLGTLLFIFSYVGIDESIFIFLPVLGNTNAHQLFGCWSCNGALLYWHGGCALGQNPHAGS